MMKRMVKNSGSLRKKQLVYKQLFFSGNLDRRMHGCVKFSNKKYEFIEKRIVWLYMFLKFWFKFYDPTFF